MGEGGTDHPLLGGNQDTESSRPDGLVVVRIDSRKAADPGVVDQDVDPAKPCRHRRRHQLDRRRIGHIHRPGLGAEAAMGQVVGDLAYTLGGDVGAGNVGTLGGEHFGGGSAHAASRAGDQDDGARYRSTAHRERPPSTIRVWPTT